MASPMVELRDVSLMRGRDVILKNVNCTILESEKWVLVGPSGHGKSSLLKLMSGLLNPTSGAVYVRGEEWLELNVKKRQHLMREMGMLFQKNALFDSLTALENVAFPLKETTDLDANLIEQKAQYYLAAVGLSEAINLYPDQMSGGMQKRLGIARALALEPSILFYDDPTAGLDPITSRRIIQLIADLQAQQKSTVVAVTNDMNRAYQLADKIAMVVDGELIVTGTPSETKSHKDPRVHQFIAGLTQGPLTAELV